MYAKKKLFLFLAIKCSCCAYNSIAFEDLNLNCYRLHLISVVSQCLCICSCLLIPNRACARSIVLMYQDCNCPIYTLFHKLLLSKKYKHETSSDAFCCPYNTNVLLIDSNTRNCRNKTLLTKYIEIVIIFITNHAGLQHLASTKILESASIRIGFALVKHKINFYTKILYVDD